MAVLIFSLPADLMYEYGHLSKLTFHIKALFWLLTFVPNVYQGEATSAKLIGQAIANNPAFITLRKIEAAREIAHTISNSANKVFLNSDDLLLNLQEMNLETAKK